MSSSAHLFCLQTFPSVCLPAVCLLLYLFVFLSLCLYVPCCHTVCFIAYVCHYVCLSVCYNSLNLSMSPILWCVCHCLCACLSVTLSLSLFSCLSVSVFSPPLPPLSLPPSHLPDYPLYSLSPLSLLESNPPNLIL